MDRIILKRSDFTQAEQFLAWLDFIGYRVRFGGESVVEKEDSYDILHNLYQQFESHQNHQTDPLRQCQCEEGVHFGHGCQNPGTLQISGSYRICTNCYDNGHMPIENDPREDRILWTEAHKEHGGAAGAFESCPLCWEEEV